MSLTLRCFALLAVLGTVIATFPDDTRAAHGPSDTSVLRAASVRLGTQRRPVVLRWLRSQWTVRSATLGLDRKTVDIRFRDGKEMLVLPQHIGAVRLPRVRGAHHPSMRNAQSPSARALVLEPFATELGLGSDPGAPVANALRAAGFAVDEGVDTQVTVQSMATLPSYAVVYMHTHAGVTQNGGGLVATGEPANGDPSVQPYLADGSVMVVGVAGSNAEYYGITSRFIAQHEAPFRSASLMFINGCALLATSDFWNALSGQGAGVLVSWNADSTNSDNYLSGIAFFNVMQQNGASVSGAIATLRQNGYGSSLYNGHTATLGFIGNGGITLAQAAASGPPIVPTPTATAWPTSAPTATATATASPTSAPMPTAPATATAKPTPTRTPNPTATTPPAPLTISGLLPTVAAGATQFFQVHGPPSINVVVTVEFPNGDSIVRSLGLGSGGSATVQFVQPSSRITRKDRTATVTVTSASNSTSARGTYRIGFGRVDLSVEPRDAKPGASVTIWVHARPRARVTVQVRPVENKHDRWSVRTGPKGWAKVRYTVGHRRTVGETLTLRAVADEGRKHPSTSSQLNVT